MTEPVQEGRAARNGGGNKAAPLLIAVAATTIVGLLEWSRQAGAGGFSTAGEVARSLLATISVYAGSGAVFGVVALVLPRAWGARGLAAVGGGLTLAAVLDREFGLSFFVAALSLALAAAWLVNRIASRLSILAAPRVWWVPFALGLAGAVAFAAPSGAPALPETAVVLLAGGAALSALFDLRSLRAEWPLGSAIAVLAMGGLNLALVMPRRAAAPKEVSVERPSLLLVTIDTLRADRIGAYGAQTAQTPNIDALARRGTRFESAISQSAFTVPSHTSILTGNYPTTHGALRNVRSRPIELPTIATLREAGYTTAAFPSADVLGPWFYTDFEYAEPPFDFSFGIPRASFQSLLLGLLPVHAPGWFSRQVYRPAPETAAAVRRWLEVNRGQPFFVWVHFFDPHLPYKPPPELVRTADGDVPPAPDWYRLSPEERSDMLARPGFAELMRAYYDAEIELVDTALGHVIEAAEHAAPGELVVAVTADHGESMGEHGLWWSRDLYEPTVRVPMIIAPEAPPANASVPTPVRTIDLMPTLFELAGLYLEGPVDGSSLVALMKGEVEEHPRAVLSYSLPEADYGRPVASLRRGDWKLIRRDAGWQGRNHWSEAEVELYNLASDPAEQSDLAGERPELVEPMSELLSGWRVRSGEQEQLSSNQRETLRALGYIE